MATILVVDDYPVVQRLLRYTLEREGHAILVASDGYQALELLAENTFDLIIMDVAMPDMDGLELLQRVRSDKTFQDLPIVMLTASGQDEDRVEARASGADAFLSKPASSRELLETVNGLLS